MILSTNSVKQIFDLTITGRLAANTNTYITYNYIYVRRFLGKILSQESMGVHSLELTWPLFS